jgi:hypothetical protein
MAVAVECGAPPRWYLCLTMLAVTIREGTPMFHPIKRAIRRAFH